MCPWVRPHAPSLGRQLWGLPSRVEYLSSAGVLLPRVYSTIASPLWLELRGPAAWQTTPSWTVYPLACHRFLPWLRVTFAMVPMQPGRARTSGLGVPSLLLARSVGWVAPVRPTLGVWFVVSRPSAALREHVCAVSTAPWRFFTGVRAWCVLCVPCAVSWASWLLFTCSLARCAVLRVRGVLGHLAPVHWCAPTVCCVVCLVSWATWPLFTGVPAPSVVLRGLWPGPLGSCLPLGSLGALCCVCGVPGHLAPVHLCARSACCVPCAASWADWPLFTGAPARCIALRVRCLGPLDSCSPVCPPGLLCPVCGVLGQLAPVHRCGRSMRCVACAVSWATSLLFTGVPARCVVLLVRCPGPLRSCSPVCPLAALCCVCGVLDLLGPVQGCARSVRSVGCAVSWATWLQFTGVHASRAVLGVHFSWATWLLFTSVDARRVVLRVRCPGPLGSR